MFENINNALSSLSQTISQIVLSQEVIKSFADSFKAAGERITKIVSSGFMETFAEAFTSYAQMLNDAYNNPDSYINYMDYQEHLNSFYWAWPFGITSSELMLLIEKAENEKQFDKLMLSFFSKQRMHDMFEYIGSRLPRKQKVIFKQIEVAYYQKQYALVNLATISIIDNILGVVLKNKGCTNRNGILLPIFDFYVDNYEPKDIGFIFTFQMLSNNIDMVFGDYNFNEKVVLDTSKKVRRHLSMHGYKYSNKRVDTVMILNTLASLLWHMEYIVPFKDKIVRTNRKTFIIDSKDYVIRNRIYKMLKICTNEKQYIT